MICKKAFQKNLRHVTKLTHNCTLQRITRGGFALYWLGIRRGEVLPFSYCLGYHTGIRHPLISSMPICDLLSPLLHILQRRRCCQLLPKDFIHIGDPIPILNETDHKAFLQHLQKGVLLSLKEKNLLTASRYAECLRQIEQECRQKDQRRD